MFWKLAASVWFTAVLCVFTIQAQTAAEHFKSGREAVASKNYGLAIKEFSAYMELSPNDSAAYFNRGLAYDMLNERERAVADYSKAIELDPNDIRAYINRAELHRKLGKANLSLADFDKAIELSPNYAKAYLYRGALHMEQTRREAALRDLDRSIELDDKVAPAFFNRGQVHSYFTNWPAAISDFYSVLRLDPSRKDLYYSLAWMEMHVGNNQVAYENVVKFLETNGMDTNRSAFALVAGYLALLRDGKKPEADRFIARFPRDVAPGVMPAKILEFLRGNLSGDELIILAGEDKMKLTDTHAIVGLKYVIDGRIDDAVSHLGWVKDKGIKTPAIYALAIIELERLERDNRK